MLRTCTLLLYDALLVRLAAEDYQKRKIRNRYIAAILLLSLPAVCLLPEISAASRIGGMFFVSVPMFLTALVIPGSFGGGDVKLTFACGAFLGWRLVLQGTAAAVLLAGVYSIYLICTKKNIKNVQFALGPFLSAGYIVSSFSLF